MLLTLHDFLTALLRGVGLLGLALAAGGVVWGLVVLRAPRGADRAPRAVRRCLEIVGLGALAMALGRGAGPPGEPRCPATARAERAGRPSADARTSPRAPRSSCSPSLSASRPSGCAAGRARRGRLGGRQPLATLIVTSGAWLTHAAGRSGARRATHAAHGGASACRRGLGRWSRAARRLVATRAA